MLVCACAGCACVCVYVFMQVYVCACLWVLYIHALMNLAYKWKIKNQAKLCKNQGQKAKVLSQSWCDSSRKCFLEDRLLFWRTIFNEFHEGHTDALDDVSVVVVLLVGTDEDGDPFHFLTSWTLVTEQVECALLWKNKKLGIWKQISKNRKLWQYAIVNGFIRKLKSLQTLLSLIPMN